MKIRGIFKERIDKRVSMAKLEGLACLTWLDDVATSDEYEKCPSTYSELRDLRVSTPSHSDNAGAYSLKLKLK